MRGGALGEKGQVVHAPIHLTYLVLLKLVSILLIECHLPHTRLLPRKVPEQSLLLALVQRNPAENGQNHAIKGANTRVMANTYYTHPHTLEPSMRLRVRVCD